MSLALGSSGIMTSAWTALMRRRFRSYALGRDGNPIKIDGYFGYDEEAVQVEYQRRTGQEPTGQVSDDDLHRLGLTPTLISTHGTGQPDPFGIGYPADIARRMVERGLYRWQPTGNYPATAVPMNRSADDGEREINRFIDTPSIVPGPVAFVDYSQGSICAGRVRNRIRRGDAPKHITLLGGVTIGNPMRPKDDYAGTVNPGGMGIDPVLETTTPGLIHLAAPGDLYTTNPGGDTGEMERAIFNAVFSRFTGRDSILEQIAELIERPFWEGIAMGRAILRGGMFLVRGTGPHVRYHIDQCPGTGQTYYEHAVSHLERLAVDRLEAMVALERAVT